MKKKWTALLLACAMVVPYGAMPAYAEALNGAEAGETESYEAQTYGIESYGTENNTEQPIQDEYGYDVQTEQDVSDEYGVQVEQAKKGGNINWNYPDNVIPTDKTVASEGCLLVGVQGSYLADAKNALKLINQYRKEACDKGYPDPRDSSRKLTSSDYVPIKWSSDLEYIARIRAAEASILIDHTRPNGGICFDLVSPNGIDSYGEVLAWNGSDSMLTGIEQWYGEKQDWLDQNDNAVTGHYTQMIDPDHLYVGIATFLNDDGVYPNATSGEFAYEDDLDEETAPAIKDCTQIIEVQKNDVSASISGLSTKVKVGYKGKAVFGISDNGCGLQYLSDVTGGAVEWSSNNEKILKVDQKGNVTAVGTGKASITAKTDCGLKASYTVTVSENTTKLSISDVSVKCASDGLNVTWKSSGKPDGFYVYRSIYQNGKWESWKRIKDVTNGNTLKWKDKNVDSSTLYRYTVRSYNTSGKSDYTDKNVVQAYFVSKPTVKLANGSKGVNVSWSKSKNASGYYIYRKEKKSDSWKKVKTADSKTTKWTDTDAKAGKQYYYTVVAYRSKSRSAFETDKALYRLAQPDFTLSNTSKGVAVKTKANKSIDGYRIYKKDSDGKWQRVATVKANKAVTWTDTSVKKNKKYTYTVRAYKKNDASSYHSGKTITYKTSK